MVDPITLVAAGVALYKIRSHKAKEREKAEHEREEKERIAGENAEREYRAMLDRAQRIQDAREAAARARKERSEAEQKLKEGCQPGVPNDPPRRTPEVVKRALQYDLNNVHLAITGVSGSGKSSLINAIRGLANNDQSEGAITVAPTGVTKTTRVIGRYPMSDVQPESRIVLYDVPDPDMSDIRDSDYFISHSLYIFDAIVVLFDDHLTQTDIAVLENCEVQDITYYVVRSKSDMHIENAVRNMRGFPSNDEYDRADTEPPFDYFRDRYKKQSRATVTDNLEQAGLSPKDVYLISSSSLLSVAKGQEVQTFLDEEALLRDLSNFVPLRLIT